MYVQSVQKKLHIDQCIVILPPFAVESRSSHQNAQKLTGNTKNGQILNIMVKYSFFQLVKQLLKKN